MNMRRNWKKRKRKLRPSRKQFTSGFAMVWQSNVPAMKIAKLGFD